MLLYYYYYKLNLTSLFSEKGKVYGFGWGEFGILGNGGNDNLIEPTLISGLTNITKIATGYKHALALTGTTIFSIFKILILYILFHHFIYLICCDFFLLKLLFYNYLLYFYSTR